MNQQANSIEGEAGFRVLFECATISILVVSDQGKIELANPCAEKLFDYSPVELIGKPIEDLIPEDLRQVHKQHRGRYFHRPKARPMGLGMELYARKKGGDVFPVAISLGHYELDGDRLAVAFITDITDQVEIKKIIAEREAWFRSMADNSPVMIWVSGTDKRCTYFNKTWLEFTGRSMEQELGNGWSTGVHPEDIKQCLKIYNDAFDSQQPFSMPFRLKRHDGEYRWIQDVGRPTFNSESQFTGYVGSCMDVQDQRVTTEELEKKVQDRTLELTGSLEREKALNDMKSRFVSMASHEFRTPLSTVLSSIHLIDQYQTVDQEHNRKKHIERVKLSVKNLNDILNDFLSLEKLEQGKVKLEKQLFNLEDLCIEIKNQMTEVLKPGQKIKFVFAGDGEIYQDKTILRNILLNLISNASKYSSEGQIELAVSVKSSTVSIAVKDGGIGIPEDQQKEIFGRFFRANNTSNISGTGLGLSIVKNYVQLLGGEISFISSPGKGTTFNVTLPTQINAL